jgi:Putative peptidoglycan binding domain
VRGRRRRGTVPLMEGRDPERDWDVDDWFDEPDTSPPLPRRGSRRAGADVPGPADEWVELEEPRAVSRRLGPRTIVLGSRTLTYPQAAVAGIAIVVVFIALLAAFGVFSSGGTKGSTPPTTPTTPATTPRTTPAATTPATTAPSVRLPTGTLKPGDSGAQVKLLQRALIKAGFSPGAVDGSYGPGTKDAVTRFQTAHGLTADGIAGSKTIAALRQAIVKSG